MKAEVINITPKIAAEWLAKNDHNRNIKPVKVAHLTGVIKRGEWILNGETIKFNGAHLIDGQHRLLAVVDAKQTIKSLVVFDADESAQETIDLGTRRNLADHLKLRGESYVTSIAGALVILYYYRNEGRMRASGTYPSPQQSLALLDEIPMIRESAAEAQRFYDHGVRFSTSSLTALHYLFSQIDADDARMFFESLASGAELPAGSPILKLRRLVIERNVDPIARKRNIEWYRAIFIKAWNAWRQGWEPDVLKWNPGGSKPEDFPVPL